MGKDIYLSSYSELKVNEETFKFHSFNKLEKAGLGAISTLPNSIKVLLEAAVRQFDNVSVTEEHIHTLANWGTGKETLPREIPFKPARVLLQDFTGVPTLVDLAAMRDAMVALGGDPRKINPHVPVDLVIDHSVMVDRFGTSDAYDYNIHMEFERNEERYRFLRWAQTAFDGVRIVPPGVGICHQVNLEYLGKVAVAAIVNNERIVYPDSLVGTDSHTPMINGLGVVGWGVGGIEAEACMLGQPLYMLLPEVIGFKLIGALREGVTATDMTLTITEMLRKKGVTDKIIEFYGSGLSNISIPDRATVGNMSPEYGATMGYFPVDQLTLDYLRMTGRDEHQIQLVEAYYKEQGMFRTDKSPAPRFTETLELDLSQIVPCLAGPKRPQDRITVKNLKQSWGELLNKPVDSGGYGLAKETLQRKVDIVHPNGEKSQLRDGSVVIAALTSCTNTSNPSVMLAAGLVAKKAVENGLTKPPYVKSSLAPGSRVVTQYLHNANLTAPLEQLGFYLAGYGCTTCIGNSGPLPLEVGNAIDENNLIAAAVLSGNRNFEGRIHAQVKANFLASPPLVIVYALAGTVNIDLETDSIGYDQHGKAIYMRDIWPTAAEIKEVMKEATRPELFREQYSNIFKGNDNWESLQIPSGDIYHWSDDSTYIHKPPFFNSLRQTPAPIEEIRGARTLLLLDNSITTDHISPAGSIAKASPAGLYLQERGIPQRSFNSYGSRRGNDNVMVRGTFANIRIRNHLLPGTEGGLSKYLPTGEMMSVFDAAIKYQHDGTDLIVIAGKEYGTGSSRDWAAKGPLLLGIKAVIAESFERIHRSNLVGMGILPLQFTNGASWRSLGIDGTETFDIQGMQEKIYPRQKLKVTATRNDGTFFQFEVESRLDSSVDVQYYLNGGILQTVIRQSI